MGEFWRNAVVPWTRRIKWPVQGYMSCLNKHTAEGFGQMLQVQIIFSFSFRLSVFYQMGFTFCLFCIRVHSVQSLMEEDLLSLAGEAGEEVVGARRFS